MPYTRDEWRQHLGESINKLGRAATLLDIIENSGAKVAPVGIDAGDQRYQSDLPQSVRNAIRVEARSLVTDVVTVLQAGLA